MIFYVCAVLVFFFCFVFGVYVSDYVALAGLELHIYLRATPKSEICCLCLRSAGIKGNPLLDTLFKTKP